LPCGLDLGTAPPNPLTSTRRLPRADVKSIALKSPFRVAEAYFV